MIGPARRCSTAARPSVAGLECRFMLASIGYTPAQIRHAYGYDQVAFQAGGKFVPGDGQGTTIALFESGDTPGLLDDLHVFDQAYGLPDLSPWPSGQAQPATPYLRKMGLGDTLPAAGADQPEAILDVEWVHAVAPAASILVVEGTSDSQLPQADALAARQPGVVVVSNSYSTFDYVESPGEFSDDPSFLTPPGHPGVTFLDSSGDTGAPSHPPDFSPYVVSVGGTSLTLDADGHYGDETGWAGSGGGLSLYRPMPAYQRRAVGPEVTRRAVPDVSIVANKSTGVSVYDPIRGGWTVGGGTSLAAPLWAAIIAIADQGRALRGLGSLDGATQTLPVLYRLPRRDFHDITAGDNGFPAHRGYDLVTGLGSPYVQRVVAGFVADTRVYPAPRDRKILTPPTSYFASSGQVVRATAGSPFNGIIATLRLEQNPALAAAVAGSVDWGDGTPIDDPPIVLYPLGRGAFQVRTVLGSAGRKTFSTPGRYRIDVSLTLPSGTTKHLHRTAVVSPALLTVAGVLVEAVAGRSASITVASFTDAQSAAPSVSYAADVHWGDGTSSPGVIATNPTAPGFLVGGIHAYRRPGLRRITASISRVGPTAGPRPRAFVARTTMSVGPAPGE